VTQVNRSTIDQWDTHSCMSAVRRATVNDPSETLAPAPISKSRGRLLVCLEADCGRTDRREGAILGVSAGFSQISDAIRAERLRESLSFLGGIRKIGC
jgi:hypothetical protein